MHIELIEKSLKNIFIDVFRAEIKQRQEGDVCNPFYSTIDVFLANNKKESIYFALSRDTLQNLLTIYMFEENNSDEDLIDFCCEFANLIIGRAKVFALNRNIFFDISTPKSVSSLENIELKEKFYFDYNGEVFMYGLLATK